jgi:PBP1b-binding outer membrane lipoprotein LpoB
MKTTLLIALFLLFVASCKTGPDYANTSADPSPNNLTVVDMSSMANSLSNSLQSEKWMRSAKKAFVVFPLQIENKSERKMNVVLLTKKVKAAFSRGDKIFFTDDEDDSKYLLYGALVQREKKDKELFVRYFSLTMYLRNRLTNEIKWSDEIEIEKAVEIKAKK